MKKLQKIIFSIFDTKFTKPNVGPFDKAMGHGKESRKIIVGATFISESRVLTYVRGDPLEMIHFAQKSEEFKPYFKGL